LTADRVRDAQTRYVGGSDVIKLEPVSLTYLHNSAELYSFFTGKNTPERQDFIISNLRIEKDLVDA